MDRSLVPSRRAILTACCLIVWALLPAAGCLLPAARGQAPELPPVGGGDKPPALPPVGGGDRNIPPASVPNAGGRARLGDPDAGPPPGIPTSRGGGGDLEFVERVIEARRAYANSLKALIEYYRSAGDTRRVQMAEEELRAFHRLPHPVYRLELDVPNPKLQPLYNQKEANDLYRWAMSFKDRGIGTEYTDNQRRAEILLQELLSKYPQSNKISDAAYMLGELYESRTFRQFERAAAYYERCFQWDPNTKYDARMRAARICDRDLKDRNRAIELYRSALEFETIPARRQEAQRRLSDLGAR